MSTPQINEETILKRYESLPDDLKEALMGVSTADAIYEVGRKANLNVEKIGALAEEVGLIILGFTPSANFISDLKTALGINEEKATEIANEINERIFLSIRESLKRLHGASWGEGLLKPPTKFEGQKVPEVKQVQPLPEIKPETKTPPPAPKEPLIIRPMGVSGAAPRQEIKGVTEIPRPAAPPTPIPKPPLPPPPTAPRPPLSPTPPTITPKPVPPPVAPQAAAPEKKPFEIHPPNSPLTEEKKLPAITPPQPAAPSAFQIKPPAAEIKPPEIKLPLKPPLEIKVEIKPTPEIKPEVKLPSPTLPTPELKPKTTLQSPPVAPPMPKPVTPLQPPAPPAAKPITPTISPKTPEAGAGYDPYKEPIE